MTTKLEEWRKLASYGYACNARKAIKHQDALRRSLREACDSIEALEAGTAFPQMQRRALRAEAKIEALEARLKAAEAVCEAASKHANHWPLHARVIGKLIDDKFGMVAALVAWRRACGEETK